MSLVADDGGFNAIEGEEVGDLAIGILVGVSKD